MPEKFNAARRVRNILMRTLEYPDSAITSEVWTSVFGIVAIKDSDFEAVRLLGLLKQEIHSVRDAVESLGLDADTYADTFNNLTGATAIGNLDAQWTTHKRYISQEILKQLDIFSQVSLVDEPKVSDEDLDSLRTDVLNFRQEVIQNITDDSLKAFVLKQIDILLRAIREFPIRGEEAIRDGDSNLLAATLSEHETIREHKEEEVVEKTMSFWERMNNLLPLGNFGLNVARMLMDMDVDPQKAIEATSKAIEAGSDIADKL